MHKPLLFLIAACCGLLSYAQIKDTLIIRYKTDQYHLAKADKHRLDSFLLRGWDRIAIHGHTDETDEEDYNMQLSKKRSAEVFNYLVASKIDRNIVTSQYFGETFPVRIMKKSKAVP